MYDARPFWLISFVQTLAIAVVAYFVAIFVYLVIANIAAIPHGALWDPSFRGPLQFVLTALAIALLSIPYWQKEWDPGFRTFAGFTVVFIIGYACALATHVVDPNLPLKWLIANAVDPLRRKLGY